VHKWGNLATTLLGLPSLHATVVLVGIASFPAQKVACRAFSGYLGPVAAYAWSSWPFAMASHGASEGLKGGVCQVGCGCQAWHPPDLEGLADNDVLDFKYSCDGCEHHLSFHQCGVHVCGKKIMRRDVHGTPVYDELGAEVVQGTCKCTHFIPDPNSKGGKFCHGCKHHTSFHLAQMAPLRHGQGGPPLPTVVSALPGSGGGGEFSSQHASQGPAAVDLSESHTPKSTTPTGGPSKKKHKTSLEPGDIQAPVLDWVEALPG
jgi:hypothetical protein